MGTERSKKLLDLLSTLTKSAGSLQRFWKLNPIIGSYRFDVGYFPLYHRLTNLERLFLRTCCYYPPHPRSEPSNMSITDLDQFQKIYEEAFGRALGLLIHGKRILDVGCGEGGFVLALARAGASHVVGLDTNPHFSHAEEVARRYNLHNTEFRQGDIKQFNDSSFDVVISHDSFEHFDEPEQVLAGMVRAAKQRGHLLIKFGPTWRSPYGRHMGGTVRIDRPWVHLIVPERMIMRVHSVYHNREPLLERYRDIEGGLNKITIDRFRRILREQKRLREVRFQMNTMFALPVVSSLPILREFFVIEVMADYVKT